MEPAQKTNATKTDLIRKIMFASGVVFSIVGVFVLLFADRMVGLVFIVAGLSDLTMSFVLPKLTEKQSGGQ